MLRRFLLFVSVLTTTAVIGQEPAPPRTSWGEPRLEGLWLSVNTDLVPFQRPEEDDDSILLELVEAGAIERVVRRERFPGSAFQMELVREARRNTLAAWRTAGAWRLPLVLEPADGRLPPLTPAGREREAAAWRTSDSGGPWRSAADFGPVERCISHGVIGSMVPALDYHAIEIVQGPGVVSLRHEAMHETRVIWVDGRPHVSDSIRGYLGDSRGRWEDGTLVVETTNLNGKTGVRAHGNELPASELLHLVERFSLAGADTLLYDVTVTDPGTWVAPWRMVFPLRRKDDYVMSEYACHEGNYAVRNILSTNRGLQPQSK